MNGIQFRKFKKQDASRINRLFRQVSEGFNKREGTKEGNRYLLSLYTPSRIRLWTKDRVILAEQGGRLVGFGRAKKNGWITHCYVRGNRMRKGLGKELMVRMEKYVSSQGHVKVHLNSSLYARGFYRKLGYRDVSKMKTYHGLRMYPMAKKIR